jgi:hypothetical protein
VFTPASTERNVVVKAYAGQLLGDVTIDDCNAEIISEIEGQAAL